MVDVGKLVRSIVAIGALTTLEMTALIMEIDGVTLSLVIGAIAGLGGYELGKKKET